VLNFLPGVVRGTSSYVFLVCNTLFWCLPLYVFAFLRFIGPASAEPWCTRRAMNIAEFWIDCNDLIINLFQKLDIEVRGLQELSPAKWYLVFCNHQTWADILILQRVFNRKIPILKFFIKQQLIYTPVIGIAWWALDFPIMKRYSREFLTRHPELRGKDLEATRRSCEKFKLTPVAILNFLEGTRFTEPKRDQQKSPFRHLLKPKGGGAALVVNSLGDRIDSVLNITIHYPDGVPGFFDFFCGRTGKVLFFVEYLPVPTEFYGGDDESDDQSRNGVKNFRPWINEIWRRKDELLASLQRTS
jgi:1-acyl-sn-glycerol-3-phosphate acyltransferase